MSTKRIYYNLMSGLLSQLVTISLGIIIPSLTLTSYGSETNGLLSSISQIYSYLALLEAGVGTATIQALYKSLSKNDYEATSSILAATSQYYHKTGILYLLAILAFSCIYTSIVETTISKRSIVLIIIFTGLGNVINFFFQGKYLLLLQADGRHYILSIMNMILNIAKNLAKILLMFLGLNVVFVQMSGMFVSFGQLAFIYYYVHTRYPWVNLACPPNHTAISQSKNVLVHQVSSLIFNNTDIIILTFFCNLKIVSVYSMYTLLLGMVSTALSTITSSFLFSLGQTFHKSKSMFHKMYECYELYYMTLVFALYSIANQFILPFLQLYTASVTDIDYIDAYLPYLFISTNLLSVGRSAASQAINFAGHFKLTQKRALFESIINIVVSVCFVSKFGIYGVLIGTIAALLYRTNDMILYANKKILHRSPWITYRRWLLNLTLFVVITALSKHIFASIPLDSYFVIVLYAILSCVVIIPIFFITTSLFDQDTARYALSLLKPALNTLHSRKK